MNTKQILKEFKERLKAVYKDNLKEVILFGSMVHEMTLPKNLIWMCL